MSIAHSIGISLKTCTPLKRQAHRWRLFSCWSQQISKKRRINKTAVISPISNDRCEKIRQLMSNLVKEN